MVKEVKGATNPEPAEGQVPAGKFEPAPQSAPEKSDPKNADKSVKEVAQEVIAGQWGRGQKSKERLKAAGYDADAVSEEVKHIFNRR